MNKEAKIAAIIEFVTSHPQSTASRTIMKRFHLGNDWYETSQELSLDLKNTLEKVEGDELEFCYYLVK